MEKRISSTSAISQSSDGYVIIKTEEWHGFSGHDYRDPKPFDIKEGSDDKIINIYANFQDKKPYVIRKKEGYHLDKHLIIDAGTHVKIPNGYVMYIFTDEEIWKKDGIRLYNDVEIFTGRRFPFQVCITHDRNHEKLIIEDGQLVARAVVVPFAKVDTLSLERCLKVKIDTNIPISSTGSITSGGSGWTRPINTNSKS